MGYGIVLASGDNNDDETIKNKKKEEKISMKQFGKIRC